MRDLLNLQGPIPVTAPTIAHAAQVTLAEAAIASGNPGELAGMLDMMGLR